MVNKSYDWENGAELEDHTKKKHTILKEYFYRYIKIRCQLPKQDKFRLAIVDGFAGAGLYKCGSYGSPIIFVETLKSATKEINIYRKDNKMKELKIECLLILNDSDKNVVAQLEQNLSPFLGACKEESQQLSITPVFFNGDFGDIYNAIKNSINSNKLRNVFFNLDQCGWSKVTSILIKDIMNSWPSAEVLLTFMISSLLTYLSPDKQKIVPN